MQKFENLGPRGPFLLILAKKQPIGTVLGPGDELVCCDLGGR